MMDLEDAADILWLRSELGFWKHRIEQIENQGGKVKYHQTERVKRLEHILARLENDH